MGQNKQHIIAYWNEWAHQIIDAYDMKKHAVDEYKGSCPVCGGHDRFHIKNMDGVVRHHCRKGCDFAEINKQLQKVACWPTQQSEPPRIEIDNVVKFDPEPKSGLYHERKGVELFNAKTQGDLVVVPIYSPEGKLVGKQTITPDGQKRFSKDMAKEGACNVVNGPVGDVCYIAEGWATSASVAQSMGKCCIFALDSGNLPKVAKAMQEKFPDTIFIVAADNDEPGMKAAIATGLMWKAPRRKGADWNDVMVQEGAQSVKKQLGSIKKPKPLFVPLGDLEFRKPQWIIDGLLEQHSFAVCFGAPAAGKTFVTLDMALSIATGNAFHEHDVKQGAVFYIAGEGHNGFARRAAAWSKERGISLKGIPFFKSNSAVIFTDEDAVDRMVDVIDQMVDQHGNPALIVIDTLARAMGAADENSTKEMGAFVSVVDEIRDRYETTILAVHHTGHGAKDRARGSSALLGAVDAEFKVEKWGENKVEVAFTKMKDATTPEPLNFIHKPVDLVDADMEEAHSVVLEKIMDSRGDGSNESRVEAAIKEEMERMVERTGQEWLSRTEVKANVAIDLGVSQRTVDRTIKNMIDVQTISYENKKLAIAWTS